MSNPSFTQVAFRTRNDDGSESTATFRQAQNTNDTLYVGQAFRVRFLIDETASVAWTNKTWNLRYSLNGGAYTAVSASTPVQFLASANFADGDDCVSRLTGGSGTFLVNNNGMKETTGGALNSGSAGNLFETEWNLQIDSAQVANGDTIALRIYDGTTAIATYTQTPTITVAEVAVGEITNPAEGLSVRSTTSVGETANPTEGVSVTATINNNGETANPTEAVSTQGTTSVGETSTPTEGLSIRTYTSVGETVNPTEALSVSSFINGIGESGFASEGVSVQQTTSGSHGLAVIKAGGGRLRIGPSTLGLRARIG